MREEENRENKTDTQKKYLTQTATNDNLGKGFYGAFEASYEFSKRNLLSGSFNMYGGNYSNNSVQYVLMENELREKQYHYKNVGTSTTDYKYLEGKVDFQHNFKKPGEMLTLSFRVSTTPATTDNDIALTEIFNYKSYNQYSYGKMKSPDYTYQVDYTKPLFKTGSLQTGVKYISRNNISNSAVQMKSALTNNQWVDDKDNSIDYKHMQDIMAAYLSYSQKFGKLNAKAGLRYEYTALDVKFNSQPDKNFDKKYSDIVPSGSVSYSLTPTQTLRLSYNMGIRRPSIWFLNPYKKTSSPHDIGYGNPNLESEKNHSFILNFSSFSQNFNLNMGLGHSFVNNSIEEYSVINSGVMETTFYNIGHARNTSLTAYVSWLVFPKTRLSLNESLSYKVIESAKASANPAALDKNQGFENRLFGSIQQTLPKSLILSFNGGFSTSRIGLQGTRSGFNHYTLSLNKSFLKQDRLTIGAFATNFLAKNVVFATDKNTVNFLLDSKTYYPMRSFGVSVSYRIGELKAQVKKAARSIVNDDVMQGDSGQGGQK